MQEKHCSLVIVWYKSRLLSLARNSQPLMSFCTHSEGLQMPSFRTKKLNIKINEKVLVHTNKSKNTAGFRQDHKWENVFQ